MSGTTATLTAPARRPFDVATRRPMVEYLASVALKEDKGTESCTEYFVYRQTPFGRDPMSKIRISGFDGGFRLDFVEGGILKESVRFDNDECDKVDLAIRILNVLDEED